MKSRAIGPVLVVAAVVATGLWLQGATPSVPTGQWQTGAALGQPRTGAVPVMLDDGRVLLIGGRAAGAPVAAVDVVNPDGSITAGIPLSLPRAGHTAVRLADGSVLVAGGTTLVAGDQGTVEAATATAEVLYAGATQWIAATGLTQARTGATATSLPDGRVLVAGGADDNGPLDTFEIYDPVSTSFHPGGLLSAARAGHAAAVAGKTSVLVAGGHNASGAVGTADIIDADTGGVVTVTMTAARDGASATALLDGRVLVAGGWDGTNDLASAEVIDPVAATTTATLPMGSPRRDHQALLLEHNATVLITGGTNVGAVVPTAEHFVAWENGFRPAANNPAVSRIGALTSALPAEGVALLAAGQAADSSLVAPTELYGFATLHTDKDDYAPGTFVTITGSGWQPGETVNMVLSETGPTPDPDVPLTAVADAYGNIFNDVWAPDEHDIGMRFYLKATGAASTAQLTFTDNTSLKNVSVAGQNPNPATPGNSVQFTVTVTYNGNGSCTASLSVSSLPTGVTLTSFSPLTVTGTNGGSAPTSILTLQTSNSTPPGSSTFSVTARGTGGAGNDCSASDAISGSGNLIVVEPTTTTLASGTNPSVFGQSITLTATVAQTAGSTVPTGGTVTFKDGAATIGTATLSAGVATLSTSALTVSGSPHSLTASYAGVANTFGSSTSSAVSQVVNQASTSTGVASSASPSVFGQSVTFTATVIPVAPGAGTRTGTVTFKDGATTLGTGTLNGAGLATFSSSSLGIGSHSITAVYAGDANFSGSTSSALPQTVNQASTTTAITNNLSTASVVGQPVTVNFAVAAVSPGAGTPTGNVTVTVNDASGNTCTGTVASGTCSITLTTPGSKTLTATYVGDPNFAGSASAGTAHTVNNASTTTTITTDLPDPSLVGDAVTVNYSVAVTAPGAGTPTGNVTISVNDVSGNTCIGTVAAGTCNITFTSPGNKTLTAVYAGDTNFNTSTSATASHTVQQAPAITSANATTFTVGAAGTFTVTATGFPAPTFSKTGALPAGVTLSAAGVLSGTPGANTGATYPITITASNGVSPDATQSFTLTVNQAPAITSANSTSFVLNSAGSFTVTATGFPAPTLSRTGTLPAGVSFDTSTGILSGTPTASGSFPLVFTASNGVGSNATQNFTLTVGQPPAITSANNTTFTVNSAGSFTVAATGFPAPTFTETGALPSGVTLSSAGVLSGTPALGTVGSYPITITAANGVGSNATQNFTLTVQKGTVSFTNLVSPAPITYGALTVGLSGRISGPAMLPGTVSVTVDGASAGPVVLNGNQNNFNLTVNTSAVPVTGSPHTITYSYSGTTDFNPATDTTTTLTVNKATPTATLTVTNSPQTYTGAPQAATVGISTSSVPGTVSNVLTGGAATKTNAGTYAVTADFVPTDSANYNTLTGLSAGNFLINKATPTATLTVSNSPQAYTGSPQSATVGFSTSSAPGATANVLTGGAATQTNAGTYAVTADFVPTDTANYNTLTGLAAGNFVINKATPTATLVVTNSPQTYTAAPQAATVGITTSSVPGALANVLTGGAATQTNAGTYAVTADFVPTDSVNYNTLTSQSAGNFVINKATPTATLHVTNSPQTYTGSPQAATVSVNTSSVPGATANVLTGGAATQTHAGTYGVTADFVPTDTTNYNTLTGLSAGNFVIDKATPTATLTVTNSPQTYTGLGLAATVGISASSVPGAVANVLTGGAATQTPAGTYAVTADFVPTDSENYNTLTGQSAGNFVIDKATPVFTVTGATCTYDGNPCPGSATAKGVQNEPLTPLNLAYSMTLGPGNMQVNLLPSAPVNAGTYYVSARYAGDVNYKPAQAATPAQIVINKATPTATLLVTNSPQTYTGAPQAASVSVGTSSVPGAPANVLTGGVATQTNAGTYAVTADFVPTDTTNYNTLTGLSAGNFVIDKATPTATLTVTNSPQTYTGLGLAATVGISASSVPGAVANVLTGGAATQTPAGTYAVTADFVPTDSENYNTPTGQSAGNFVIDKATPVFTVTGATCTYDGNPCPGSATAKGVQNEPLTPLNLAYSMTLGPGNMQVNLLPSAPVNAGTYYVSARYAGDVNYKPAQATTAAQIVIHKATPTATLAVTNSPQTYTGAGLAATVGITISSVPGVAANVLTGGAATQTPAGTYAVTADFVPNDNANYNTLTGLAAGNFVIDKATPTATLAVTNSPKTYTGVGLAATVGITISSVPGATANVLTGGAATQTAAGTYAVTADFVPTDATNYNTLPGLAAGNFAIDKANPVFTVSGQTCTYNGNPCAGTATAKGVQNEDLTPVNVAYSATLGPGNVLGSQMASAPVNAGTYYIAARYPGDGNYNGKQSVPAAITINKATATWTTNPNSKVFGASDPSPLTTGSGSGFVDPVTAAYSRTIGEGVASYPITATLSGALGVLDNYTVTNAGASFTITPAATMTAITHDDPDPSVLNSAYVVNWSVTVKSPGSGTPTGTVMVSDGSASCSAAVATGGCSLTSTTLGTKSLSATYSGDGNFTGSAGSASHNVQYAFTGFYAPVDNSPVVNKANAGQAIPVKWRLTDTNGVGISDPSSFTSLTAYTVPCNAWASLPTDPQLLDQVSTSGLLYQGNGNWQYNWKTPKNYANSCMVARVTLADGSTHDFDVSFK